MSDESKEKSVPPMQAERVMLLLNAMIDHMVNDTGGRVREVIDTLLDLGFSPEELTEHFQFSSSDVEECLEEASEEEED